MKFSLILHRSLLVSFFAFCPPVFKYLPMKAPATEVISKEVIQVVLHLDKRPKATLTARELWHTIARFGGYLDRKSDPPPGWQTLWKGWIRVMTVLEGVHLARQFSP